MHIWQERCIWNSVEDQWWNVFAEVVNGFQLLTIFAKISILKVWLGSEYASGQDPKYAFAVCTLVFPKT